jgi:peptide/nickel transport system ATP-binding protein
MIAEPETRQILLEIIDLRKYYPFREGFLGRAQRYIKAVDGVTLTIYRGETLGLVGESGCGKTTLGRATIQAVRPSSGQVMYHQTPDRVVDLTRLSRRELKPIRKNMQYIFQDPYASLNPRMTLLDIVGEPLDIHGAARHEARRQRVRELLDMVGLRREYMARYPHAFSGGQRQRIGIARALALNPEFLVCDEPVSALDVSIQAQILNLLQRLQADLGLTYLFVAHDLSVVEHISDRVAVMYVGRVAELAETRELFARPLHPYTESLLSAVPRPDPRDRTRRITLRGEVPSPANPPTGCYFHPRCRYAQDICEAETPTLQEVRPDHFASCHFAGRLDLQGYQPAQGGEAGANENENC